MTNLHTAILSIPGHYIGIKHVLIRRASTLNQLQIHMLSLTKVTEMI